MKAITIEQILSLLPKKVSLHWIDRGQNFDDSTELIQKCITAGNLHALYEQVDDWYLDDHYGFDEVVEKLKSDMEDSFDLDEGEVTILYDNHQDAIRDAIYDRDDSDVVNELFRNTDDMVFFYDTGHYVQCAYPCDDKEITAELREIKKVIKLKGKDYDKLIKNMMYQASYGGNLVIYFTANPRDILRSIEEGVNTISFSGEVNIAIPNHSQGAGDHTSFNHSFSLPFSKDNLFLCKEVKYSYTYEVCGMSSSWCASTHWKLTEEKKAKAPATSATARHMAREAELNAVYASGGCSPGDLNFSRHRNVEYHDDPMYCRHECPMCHTTWLD